MGAKKAWQDFVAAKAIAVFPIGNSDRLDADWMVAEIKSTPQRGDDHVLIR